MSKNKKKVTVLPHRHLAEGEMTGHFHESTKADSRLLREDGSDVLTLEAPTGTEVTHQEHNTIALPPGNYAVHIVKEFDHLKEEARRVMD